MEAFTNRKMIWNALKNNIFKQDHIEALYQERLEICNECPFLKEKGDRLCGIPGTHPCCPECGCSLALKLRAPDVSCPVGRWEAVMTSQEAQLLNTNLYANSESDRGQNDNQGDSANIQNGDGSDKGQQGS